MRASLLSHVRMSICLSFCLSVCLSLSVCSPVGLSFCPHSWAGCLSVCFFHTHIQSPEAHGHHTNNECRPATAEDINILDISDICNNMEFTETGSSLDQDLQGASYSLIGVGWQHPAAVVKRVVMQCSRRQTQSVRSAQLLLETEVD